MRGYLTSLLLLLVVLLMVMGSQAYVAHEEAGEEWNAFNYTETVLGNVSSESNIESNLENSTITGRGALVVTKFYELYYETCKWAFEFGYENPQYDFVFFMIVFLVLMLLPGLIPLIALVYLLCVWVKDKLRKKT